MNRMHMTIAVAGALLVASCSHRYFSRDAFSNAIFIAPRNTTTGITTFDFGDSSFSYEQSLPFPFITKGSFHYDRSQHLIYLVPDTTLVRAVVDPSRKAMDSVILSLKNEPVQLLRKYRLAFRGSYYYREE